MKSIAVILLICVSAAVALINPSPVKLVGISTPFPSPVGIDYHAPTNTLIQSVNYNTGGNPFNFERVELDGTHVQFSNIAGLTDEVKIATVRSGNPQFPAGEFFVGNGVPGQVMRISGDGLTVVNPWVTLPYGGLIRGGLYVDQTGIWNYDLLVCTDNGYVYRVDGTGSVTLVGSYPGLHFEGILTVANKPEFGELAGRVIVGNEDNRALFSWTTAGSSSMKYWFVSAAIEDIDESVHGENFFGNNFGTNRLVGASGSQFPPNAIIVTQEFPDGGAAASGLYVLQWDASSNQPVTTPIPLTSDSYIPGQWEHSTFAPTGVVEVPPENDCDNKHDFFGPVASAFNVFSLGVFTCFGSDTGGRLAAKLDINAIGYGFGTALPLGPCDTPVDEAQDTVVAGGSINFERVGVKTGHVVYGNSQVLTQTGLEGVNCSVRQQSNRIDFASAANILNSRSTQIKNLAVTGNTTFVDYWKVQFTCSGSASLEVFDTTGINWSQVHGYGLSGCNPNASIFINVPGTSVALQGGSFIDQFYTLRNHIVWNFHEAVGLTLNGLEFQGSILLPGGCLGQSNGNVNGQVMAGCVSGQWNCPEFHDYAFEGCI